MRIWGSENEGQPTGRALDSIISHNGYGLFSPSRAGRPCRPERLAR